MVTQDREEKREDCLLHRNEEVRVFDTSHFKSFTDCFRKSNSLIFPYLEDRGHNKFSLRYITSENWKERRTTMK